MIQFIQSKTWRLTWADPQQAAEDGTPNPHDSAVQLLHSRLHGDEEVKFVFACGESRICFTSWRILCIEQAAGSLIRTVSTLPYRHIVTLETDGYASDARCMAMRGIRIHCSHGFTGTFLFADQADVLPQAKLDELESLMTAKMES